MSRYYREGSPGPPGNTRDNFTPGNSHNDPPATRNRDGDHERGRDYRDRDYDRDYDRDRSRNRDRDRSRNRDHDRDHGRGDRRRNRDNRPFPAPGANSYRPHELPPRPPPTGPSAARDGNRPSVSFSFPSRNGQSDGHRPPQGEFNFRANAPETVQREIARFERDGAAPAPGQYHAARTRDARDARDGRNARRNQHPNNTRKFQKSSYPRRVIPAERALLSGDHADAPTESLFDPENGVTYRALDELSDSEEADMDISDDSDSDADGKEPSQKRARVSGIESTTGQNVPKWSNPDPYTAAPPGGASQAKKKDVVQLIRKARVQAKDTKSSIPTEAADFISCDFDDSDDEVYELPQPAPSGPRIPTTSAVQTPTTSAAQIPTTSAAQIPTTALDVQTSQMPSPKTAYLTAPIGPAGLPPKPVMDLTKPETVDLTMGGLTERYVEPLRQIDLVAGSFPAPPLPASRTVRDPFPDPSPASLGSRKRTHEDQIKGQPSAPKHPKHPGGPSRGYVTSEWLVVSDDTATPWFVPHHDVPAGSNEMLHREIVDFYNYIRPRQFEENVRREVFDNIAGFCRHVFPDARVYPFGSYPSGLYLPTGDMDLAFLSDRFRVGEPPKYHQKGTLFKMRSFLTQFGKCHGQPEVISKAKVPLVKFVEVHSRLKFDISFENATGLVAVDTFKAWKKQYPAMPVLVTLIKQFMMMRGLNEPVNGGIGGFSVICLVVSLFQLHPEAQTLSQDTRNNMGKLLLTFFDFYGNQFRYDNVAISLDPPKYIPKNEVVTFAYKNLQRLSIIDPNNPENDIAGGSSNFYTVAEEFSRAHHQLCERMQSIALEDKTKSILFPILAGNYSTFEAQRDRMEELSRTKPWTNLRKEVNAFKRGKR